MFKKILKENAIPSLLFLALAIYGTFVNPHYLEITKYLVIAGVATSAITTTMFFIVPAKYAAVAFGLMFAAIVSRMFLLGILSSIGIVSLASELVPIFIIFTVISLILYKLSLFLFMNDTGK